jgi:hypothetical protein
MRTGCTRASQYDPAQMASTWRSNGTRGRAKSDLIPGRVNATKHHNGNGSTSSSTHTNTMPAPLRPAPTAPAYGTASPKWGKVATVYCFRGFPDLFLILRDPSWRPKPVGHRAPPSIPFRPTELCHVGAHERGCSRRRISGAASGRSVAVDLDCSGRVKLGVAGRSSEVANGDRTELEGLGSNRR